jgi:hypothetical protein
MKALKFLGTSGIGELAIQRHILKDLNPNLETVLHELNCPGAICTPLVQVGFSKKKLRYISTNNFPMSVYNGKNKNVLR